MFKKIILGLVGVIIIVVGTLFVMNGSDNYDQTKYSASVSDGMNVGSKISFSLPDQFDKKHTLSSDTKILIFSFSKATGHTMKDMLSKESDDYLSSRDALFIADVSPMPTVIRNTFALPDLRKSSFPVVLIYDKAISSKIKNDTKADKIAVLTLEDATIIDAKYLSTEEEVKALLN